MTTKEPTRRSDLPTRIAVAGATGHIGTLVSSILERRGVDVVPISRSHGLDLTAGVGLAKVLAGVDAVLSLHAFFVARAGLLPPAC